MSLLFSGLNKFVPWTKLSTRRQGHIVIILPLACLLSSLMAFTWLRYSLNLAQTWVDHTNTVLLKSNRLLNTLLVTESEVRGYALTGDPQFLKAYNTSQDTLLREFDALQELVSDNPTQKQRMIHLRQATRNRLALFAAVIATKQSGPSSLTQFSAPVLQGKAQMDQFYALLHQFQQSEQRLLKERRRNLNLQWQFMDIALWLAIGIGILGSFVALTLFSQVERSLREREQKLHQSRTLMKAVVENVVDGVVITNSQGQIEVFNLACEQMFGYGSAEVIAQDLSMLLADPAREESKDETELTLGISGLKVGQRWQTSGCRKGNETFPIEVSVSPLNIDTSQMIVIIRDMTDREAVEAKLQARADELAQLNLLLSITNEMLQSRNRELDQFAYVASHDLKAPLRAISHLSEWIEEDLSTQLSAENRSHINLLRSRVRRMDALIDGLLEYSRVGRVQVPLELVNVGELILEVVDMLSPPDGFQVEIISAMPTFMARRIFLKQVFSNLIDNAIQHHPEQRGTVTITVADRNQWYEFAVRDDGAGIEPQYHEKIFSIFQTLEARDVRESTGIGLSIVKKILDTEGGAIQVDSQMGKGATFRFTWPKSTLR
ncbi:MAG TPA: CHASE3 domain-containing protein [Stenomitos sp.]